MAKNETVKLTPEMKNRLETMQDDIDKAKEALTMMKRHGMDTKALEEKLEWAKSVKDDLLKEFS